MRSLVLLLPASLVFVAGLQAQALTEHAAAAAGATIGTAAGKGLSNSMTKIFGDIDKQTDKATNSKKPAKPVSDPQAVAQKNPGKRVLEGGSESNSVPIEPTPFPAAPRHRAPRPAPAPAPAQPANTVAVSTVANPSPAVAAPPAPEPVAKVPTAQEFASIKAGASGSDMIAVLGLPSSRVIIPDDDGHLREICQYWANGKVLGTIRLDNGQVASVEPLPEN